MDLQTKLKMYEGAKEILKDRKHWGKGSYAQVRTSDGIAISTAYVYDEDANNFCLIGALGRSIAVNKLVPTRPEYEALSIAKQECIELAECVPKPRYPSLSMAERVISFNDKKSTRHSMVLKALDCAINAVKATIGQQ